MSLHNNRIAALQEKLQESKLDGVLYAPGAAFVYLLKANAFEWQRQSWTNISALHTSGLSLMGLPEALLYVPADGEAAVLATPRTAPRLEAAGVSSVQPVVFDRFYAALSRLVKGGTVGVGDLCEAYLTHLIGNVSKDIAVVPGEMLCAQLRTIKEPEEIVLLESAAELTDAAMAAILGEIRTGISAYEVEEFFTRFGLQSGASDLSFSPTCGVVKTGDPEAQAIDGRAKTQPIVPGCGIAFDLGYVLDGYCSDFGRSFYYGAPPPHCANAYAALQAGQVHMIENIRPYETSINELYGFVKAAVEAHGFAEWLRFPDTGSLGHQIGVDCHEHPMLNNATDFILRPGMVFASEPKIWLPGDMYMRVEDMILVTDIGARSLTKFSRVQFELEVRD